MERNKGSQEDWERGERVVGGGFKPGGSTESHTLAVMGVCVLCGKIQDVHP